MYKKTKSIITLPRGLETFETNDTITFLKSQKPLQVRFLVLITQPGKEDRADHRLVTFHSGDFSSGGHSSIIDSKQYRQFLFTEQDLSKETLTKNRQIFLYMGVKIGIDTFMSPTLPFQIVSNNWGIRCEPSNFKLPDFLGPCLDLEEDFNHYQLKLAEGWTPE